MINLKCIVMKKILALALIGAAAAAIVSNRRKICRCMSCCCPGDGFDCPADGSGHGRCKIKEGVDIVQQRYERAKESVLEHYNQLKQGVKEGYSKASENVKEAAGNIKEEVAGKVNEMKEHSQPAM